MSLPPRQFTCGQPPRPGPPLSARVSLLLSQAGRTAAARFAERLQPLGLRPRQFLLLNHIALAAGSSQQQLGQRLGQDPSGLVSTLDELEQQGLVERRRNPSDRRRHALHLTAAGEEMLARGREVARERGQELLSPLTDEEAELFHDLLLRVAAVD